MQTGSKHIITIGVGIGIISLLYFAALISGMPVIVPTVLAMAALFFFIRWLYKPTLEQETAKDSQVARIVLLIFVVIFTNKAYYTATKYGFWDAWAIWNLHAAYFADAVHWKNLFHNTISAHPDYPLALPATLAFFNRLLCHVNDFLTAYAFHFLITLCIPLLIYLETYRKSIIVSGLVLILFATNEFFIAQGLGQLADTLLGFFLLCAMVCMSHQEQDSRMLVLSAAFLGLCLWTKNEGIIIMVIFCLFHLKELFAGRRIKYAAAGFAISLLGWAIFKFFFAPPNDMVAGQDARTLSLLTDWSRYHMIYDFFIDNVTLHFKDATYGVLIYILLCVIARRAPDKRLLIIFVILLCYMMVYVVSPHDLEWHLFTSQSRLLHQLMPATMYILALRFSGSTRSNFRARFFSVR